MVLERNLSGRAMRAILAVSIAVLTTACGASSTDADPDTDPDSGSGDAGEADAGEVDAPPSDAGSDSSDSSDAVSDAGGPVPDGGEDVTDAGQDVSDGGDVPNKPGCVDPTTIGLVKWGDMHVHSTNSDGDFAPSVMMQAAKDQGADFVWITDHSQSFEQSGSGPLTPGEFASCMSSGAAKTTASFLARCGIEWRLGYQSQDEKWHGVMLGMTPDQFPGRFAVESYTNWDEYLADMDGAGTVALITHPTGPANWTLGKDPGRNTDPEANGELDVYELNGEGTVVSRINYFFDWLNAGWKVSPVYDTDMHHSKWAGVEGPKTAGVWIKDGTWSGNQWPALRVAMRAHRTFANYPGQAKNYIRLVSLDAGGEPECMMGSTLPATVEPLRLEITVNASQKQWHFRLFTNQKSAFGTPVASAAPADTTLVDGEEQRWRPTIDTSGVKWIAVVATRGPDAPANDNVWLVSAPLWLGDT
jgi:hypothetical protein